MTILLAILASLAAFLGGMIALKFRDKLHLILGFSAGAVLGAALFDLIPEAIELGAPVGQEVGTVTMLVAIGFLAYLILDRAFSFHNHNHDEGDAEVSPTQGIPAAISFSLHSLIDGLAIGFAFQASSALGVILSLAVIAHRFSDGINTVGVILRHRGENKQAIGWLTVVALAPIVGAALTYFFTVSTSVLAILLSIFAGFFLYIGASDLIPEGHHSHSKILTTVMTILGAVVLYIIVHVAH